MLITDTPLDTFDKVFLDTLGKMPTTPDGNKHILTMQDNLSTYCIVVLIPDISANTVAHAIAKHLFSQYGAPRVILTDRGENSSLERSHAVLMDYIRAHAEI